MSIAHLYILRIIHEFTCITIAFVSGLVAFRHMNLLHRIFFYQLIAYFLIIFLSYAAQLIPNMKYNNQWVYNLGMPIEAGILSWAAYEYLKNYREKFLIWAGGAVFLIVFISALILKGPLAFSNYGYIAEGILLVALYLSILYVQFANYTNIWKRSPEIWLGLGVVLYFAGVVPYFSLFDYLLNNHPKISLYLFNFVTVGLSDVRYLLLAYGFWLVRRNALAKTTTVNE